MPNSSLSRRIESHERSICFAHPEPEFARWWRWWEHGDVTRSLRFIIHTTAKRNKKKKQTNIKTFPLELIAMRRFLKWPVRSGQEPRNRFALSHMHASKPNELSFGVQMQLSGFGEEHSNFFALTHLWCAANFSAALWNEEDTTRNQLNDQEARLDREREREMERSEDDKDETTNWNSWKMIFMTDA